MSVAERQQYLLYHGHDYQSQKKVSSTKSSIKNYNVKYVCSGNIIERYEYEIFQTKGICNNSEGRKGIDFDLLERRKALAELGYNESEIDNIIIEQNKLDKEKQLENRKYNLYKSRQKIQRYVNCNSDLTTFFTFTFKDNIDDFVYAHNEFKKAIQRINRYMKKINIDFKYLAVLEFQKRGAIHYHIMCNYPLNHNPRKLDIITTKSDKKKLEGTKWFERWFACDMWDNNGFVDVRNIKQNIDSQYGSEGDDIDNVGAYLSKYLTKDTAENNKMQGYRIFYNSQNLEKPTIIENNTSDNEEKDFLEEVYNLKNMQVAYDSTYTSDYTGIVKYSQWNLKRK
jgi:hypothetical protein